jgi:hypothetical protein
MCKEEMTAGLTRITGGEHMRASRRFRFGWIEGSLLAAIGATVAATLLLGSSSALAADSKNVSASTLLNHACHDALAAPALRGKGQVTTGGKTINIDFYFGSAGDLLTVTQNGDQTLHVIVNGPSTYLKGNKPFWLSATKDSGVASLLADRWIDMTSDRKDVADITKDLTKKSLLSQCGRGSPATYVGHATVNGIRMSKVHQAASGESNTYYIENGTTPYILKIAGSPSQKDSGGLVFSDYGVQPEASEPPGATPISELE